MARISLKVLGPIEVSVAERMVRLSGQKQRAALAALALDLGRAVSVARLVDVLWGDRPPVTARAKVQDHISTLRRVLGQPGPDPDGPLLTCPPGYSLNPDWVALDLTEFAGLITRGRAALESRQWELTSELLAAALGLWRGAAFADVVSAPISAAAAALAERRLLAVEAKAEADLACGRYEVVATELAGWLVSHPLRERLRAMAMLALCGVGCRAEALALYRAGRLAMVEELGIEPGAQLSRLHDRILAGDLLSQANTPLGWLGDAGPFSSVFLRESSVFLRESSATSSGANRHPKGQVSHN